MYAPLYPALTVFIMGYLLSVGITTVLEAAIDTIYLCAFKDMEANTLGPKYMSDDLREAFGIDKAPEEAGRKAESFVPVSHCSPSFKRAHVPTAPVSRRLTSRRCGKPLAWP